MKEMLDYDVQSYDEVMNVAVVEIKESNGAKHFLAMSDDHSKSFGKGESAEAAISDLESQIVEETSEPYYQEALHYLN